MKRIAFIDYGFTGSLLPLIRRLLLAGHTVDLYEMASLGRVPKLEACTFDEIPCAQGVHGVPLEYIIHLRDYLDFTRFGMYSVSAVRPFGSVPVVHRLAVLLRNWQLRRVAGKLNSAGYDVVNLVGNYWHADYCPLLESLRGPRLLSLHEVCNHAQPDFSRQPALVRCALRHDVPFAVFSRKSYTDILRYPDVKGGQVHELRFGCFESYRQMLRPSRLSVGRDYFLFVGYLRPYKGIDVFCQAISLLAARRHDMRFVIAGRGDDPSLSLVEKLPQVTVLRQYIENDDFACLLNGAYAVVCPYRTASQSGVPQSAFVFGRPVVATDIDGFRQLLGGERYGLLCEPGSAQPLADTMERLWDDRGLHDRLSAHAADFDAECPEYDWNRITQEYLSLLDSVL